MTTALEMITDALREIGAHDLGQEVPAEVAQLGLRKLNQMLQSWSNSPAAYPVLPEITVTMSGAASYTIGPSGDVVAARPIRVDRATYVLDNIEYPVNVLSRAEWDAIAAKDITGSIVSDVWYDAANTDGRLYTYPKSSEGEIRLDAPTLLASFASLSTDVTLPVGYEAAMTLNLAVAMAGPLQVPQPQGLQARAAGALRVLKRMNAEPLLMSTGLTGEHDYEIERGY